MSNSVNKVILVGRLGKDPEVRYTGDGKAVASFSLATDESYKNKDGERIKKTEWHNLVVWGNSVENFVQPYLHKGDMIFVEGKLQTRSWEDKKNGGTRYTTEVNVTNIVGLVIEKSDAPVEKSNTKNTQKQTARPTPSSNEISDEDIPF